MQAARISKMCAMPPALCCSGLQPTQACARLFLKM